MLNSDPTGKKNNIAMKLNRSLLGFVGNQFRRNSEIENISSLHPDQ